MRIGVDLDNVSRLNLLKTFFNAKHFFPNTKIEVKATAHGYHIRIYKQHSIEQNINVRRSLNDDPMRLMCDENRIIVGLEDWVDTLFFCKQTGTKVTHEVDCNILSLPSCSRVPCKKNWVNKK